MFLVNLHHVLTGAFQGFSFIPHYGCQGWFARSRSVTRRTSVNTCWMVSQDIGCTSFTASLGLCWSLVPTWGWFLEGNISTTHGQTSILWLAGLLPPPTSLEIRQHIVMTVIVSANLSFSYSSAFPVLLMVTMNPNYVILAWQAITTGGTVLSCIQNSFPLSSY